ncbi:MAG: POTRA domain-containing protein, partial [Cyanobacteriota bacterium]|nr:POTRA domain-containing protein [Cyanobacteriota bacterium]
MIGSSQGTFAQDVPPLITPPEPLPRPTPIPQPLPPPPLQVDPPSPVEPDVPETPETISVERFEFEGNTAYSDEELAEVTAEFLGEITFAELLQAESAVTQFYVESGFVNSGAILPAGQNLSDGVITIQIIEGGLEEITVTGT